MSDPFHPGERAIQEITGERAAAEANGRVIGKAVPPPAVPFVAAQDMAIIASEDAEGRLWAGIVFGPKGFATVTDDRHGLVLRPSGGATAATAPLHELAAGDRVGTLFIELATRRRLRINGTIAGIEDGRIEVEVAEAYPACPKYIQRRLVEAAPGPAAATAAVEMGTDLTNDLRAWIAGTDTLFVASGPRGGRLDVSHRGGAPGFVRRVDGRLRVPDYPGNSMFNTLGNLHLDPRAAVVIPDFATGRQLSLTGTATLHVEGPATGDRGGPTGGTDRWWDFAPEAWVVTTPAAPRRWGPADASPFNPVAGEVA
jgi:predicted pyridoxine 5'-phosphate oxidase superfamily flavin-nucleotide-binding protein